MSFVPSGSTFVSDMAMDGRRRYMHAWEETMPYLLLYTPTNHRWVNDDQLPYKFPRSHPDISDCIFLASTFHRNKPLKHPIRPKKCPVLPSFVPSHLFPDNRLLFVLLQPPVSGSSTPKLVLLAVPVRSTTVFSRVWMVSSQKKILTG